MVDKVEEGFSFMKLQIHCKVVTIGKPIIVCDSAFLYSSGIWHSTLIFFMSILSSSFFPGIFCIIKKFQ